MVMVVVQRVLRGVLPRAPHLHCNHCVYVIHSTMATPVRVQRVQLVRAIAPQSQVLVIAAPRVIVMLVIITVGVAVL